MNGEALWDFALVALVGLGAALFVLRRMFGGPGAPGCGCTGCGASCGKKPGGRG